MKLQIPLKQCKVTKLSLVVHPIFMTCFYCKFKLCHKQTRMQIFKVLERGKIKGKSDKIKTHHKFQ